MFFDVSLGAQQTLLFTAPESQADSPRHFELERFQDAHDLQNYRRPHPVVCGAGPSDPGVEVSSQHHDLITAG